jgi:hypothetical protein
LLIIFFVIPRPDDSHTAYDQKEIMALEPLDEFHDDDFDFVVHNGRIISQNTRRFGGGMILFSLIGDSNSSTMVRYLLVQIIPFCTVIGLASSWYIQKLMKRRSGRHKKIDC